MNITELSIKRPAFISSLMITIITVGYIAFKKMNVELFPNIDIPIIFVSTRYDGADAALAAGFSSNLAAGAGVDSNFKATS